MKSVPLTKGSQVAGRSLVATALATYLLLFSSVALVHTYAQDELTDTHGCVIGAWVQHASATDAATAPLATLVLFSEFLPSGHDAVPQSATFGRASRGPPLSAL